DHFLGHAVAEIFLPNISRQILERKDRQHHPSAWLSRRIGPPEPTDVPAQCRDQNNAEGGGERPPGFRAPATRQRSPTWSVVTFRIQRPFRLPLFLFIL